MSVSVLEVTSLHAIPVVPLNGSVTLSTVSGDTIYYGQDQTVSSSNNTGSLTAGGSSVTLTTQAWVTSAGVSAMKMVSGSVLQDVVLGNDGLVGGSGGTGLTTSAVTDSSADQPGGAKTKRVTIPLSGDGSAGAPLTGAAYENFMQRVLAKVPYTSKRWRLEVQNAKVSDGTLYAGVLSFTGVYIGTPSRAAGQTQWEGNFTAAPTRALAAFATNADGSNFATDWVTDPALQFSEFTEKGLSWGYTAPGGTQFAYGSYGSLLKLTNGSTHVGDQNMPLSPPSADQAVLDVRLVVEYLDVLDKVPVVLAVGDSITRGLVPAFETGVARGVSGGIYQHQNALGHAAMRSKLAVINVGVGGTKAATWAADPSTNLLWRRADLATTVPEIALIALGSNDVTPVANAQVYTISQIQTNLEAVIANARTTYAIKRIWLATIIPRNLLWPTGYEVDSLATSGSPTGGSLAVKFSILGLPFTTASGGIVFNATAAQVAAAVQATLPLSLPNAVVGSGGPLGTNPVTLTWQNAGYGPITDLGLSLNALTGGSSPSATFTSSVAGTESGESQRVTINNWIRQLPSGIDGVIDWDQIMCDPLNPTALNPVYSDVQEIHPWLGGQQRMGSGVNFR